MISRKLDVQCIQCLNLPDDLRYMVTGRSGDILSVDSYDTVVFLQPAGVRRRTDVNPTY